MLNRYLLCLGFLTSSGAWRPPHRGAFAPVPADNGTAGDLLSEGDIASHTFGSSLTLDSFRADEAALWPGGKVRYRIAEDEWKGVWEPVFRDDQIENISISLRKIEEGVPCIDFE